MSQRIRSLEDALAILQATVSEERHPLLEDELLKVKLEQRRQRQTDVLLRRRPLMLSGR